LKDLTTKPGSIKNMYLHPKTLVVFELFQKHH